MRYLVQIRKPGAQICFVSGLKYIRAKSFTMAKAAKKPATKKPIADIMRMPGNVQFQRFLYDNPALFNLSEFERLCNFPGGRLRHIRAGSRDMTESEYKKVQEVLLPKLCEAVLLLQLYQAGTGMQQTRKASRIDDNWDDDD